MQLNKLFFVTQQMCEKIKNLGVIPEFNKYAMAYIFGSNVPIVGWVCSNGLFHTEEKTSYKAEEYTVCPGLDQLRTLIFGVAQNCEHIHDIQVNKGLLGWEYQAIADLEKLPYCPIFAGENECEIAASLLVWLLENIKNIEKAHYLTQIETSK
jgi:hypothetical protein